MDGQLKRIAYVEDDPDIRELTELALTQIGGYDVAVYASGPEALARITAFQPDMVLLDVMMPEMDGPEVFERLNRIDAIRSVPKAFMTAKARRDEIEGLIAIGAVGVIAKPFDPMTLSSQVLDLWRSTAHAA